MTTLTEVVRHPSVQQRYGILLKAAEAAASPQIRNQGTIGGNVSQDTRCWYYRAGWSCYRAGGNICYADTPTAINREHAILDADRCVAVNPSDTSPALIALQAEMVIRSRDGERVVPAEEYFVGPGTDITRMTVLRTGRAAHRRSASLRRGPARTSTSRRSPIETCGTSARERRGGNGHVRRHDRAHAHRRQRRRSHTAATAGGGERRPRQERVTKRPRRPPASSPSWAPCRCTTTATRCRLLRNLVRRAVRGTEPPSPNLRRHLPPLESWELEWESGVDDHKKQGHGREASPRCLMKTVRDNSSS